MIKANNAGLFDGALVIHTLMKTKNIVVVYHG